MTDEYRPDVTVPQAGMEPSVVMGQHGRVRTGLAAAAVFVELTPLNEALRYPVIAASQFVDAGPVMGALSGGLSTALVEGMGTLAAADLFATNRGRNVVDRINNKVNAIVPEDAKLPKLLQYGLMMVGGSVVAMAVKQRELVDRSFRGNVLYGSKATAIISGSIALQGAAVGLGAEKPSTTTLGLAVGAVGGLLGAVQWARGRIAALGRNRQVSSM